MGQLTMRGYMERIDRCVYTYRVDFGTWYAEHRSKVARFTDDELKGGMFLEDIVNKKVRTAEEPIMSERDLYMLVDS